MHVVPRKTYYLVFAGLLVLMVLTVGVTLFDFGPFNVVIALAIAGSKATLIVLYFMHIRWASALTCVVALIGFLWLVHLIGWTMSDYATRGWMAQPPM
jgi:cytochrome c oxidase subunit IV